MQNQILFLLVLTFIFSCTPEQEATKFNVTNFTETVDEIADEELSDQGEEVVDEEEEEEEEVTDYEQTQEDCEQAMTSNNVLTYSSTINFPAAIECEFNENGYAITDINQAGNGPRIDTKITARVEQNVQLQLPSSGKICDINFNFPTQNMQYDDEILLLLNGVVLMSSTNYGVNSGSSHYALNGLGLNQFGQQLYSWSGTNALYGLHYGQAVTAKYCLGLDNTVVDYGNKCQIPATETLGQIKLDIPQTEIIKLGFAGNNLGELSDINFGFVSTGDNDNGDCEHSAFSFDVTIKYIQ